MKFSLAFTVYNKERWIQSLLESWVDSLSGLHEYEIIMVFDDLKDRSHELAEEILAAREMDYHFLFADNEYEIFCNDLAFQHATGDFIVFIQDDNWIYDKEWDDTLAQVLQRIDNVGAVGLLAGLQMNRDFSYRRVEVYTPHKGKYFHSKEVIDLAVWSVDAINRPFAVSVELLEQMSGLDFEYRPTCGDDLDLSLKLLEKGYTNVYIPFDVTNTVGSSSTMSQDFLQRTYAQAIDLCRDRYGDFIRRRVGTNTGKLFSLKSQSDGLRVGNWESFFTRDLRGKVRSSLLPLWIVAVYEQLNRFSPRRLWRSVGRRLQGYFSSIW